MKAKHIPRIDIHDRTELKNALPLRTPYVIYIDPCDTCNFRCKFCLSGILKQGVPEDLDEFAAEILEEM